ncbi:MAG: pentapeptide repeat-containing protein [Thermodesulfovibrionales bacterium]
MRKIILGMVVVFFVMMTAVAYGFNEADLKKLRKTNQCPDCDLSGADMTQANLRGANLQGAILTNANLSGTHLFGATWTDGRKCAVTGSIGVCK